MPSTGGCCCSRWRHGCPKLLASASGIDWTAIPQREVAAASHLQLEQFVVDNRKFLSELDALARQRGAVDLTYTPVDFETTKSEKLLELPRALTVEARLAYLGVRHRGVAVG